MIWSCGHVNVAETALPNTNTSGDAVPPTFMMAVLTHPCEAAASSARRAK